MGLLNEKSTVPELLVASLVPMAATFVSNNQRISIETSGDYPFSDLINITVNVSPGGVGIRLKIRIPGWAVGTRIGGQVVGNGTTWISSVALTSSSTVYNVELNPQVRAEFGWGELAAHN